MLKEFKEFALKGNVLDMAIGIIIGAAFTTVVNSLVSDIFQPLLGLLTPDQKAFDEVVIKLTEGAEGVEGAQIKIGAFAGHIVQFLLVAFAVFLLVKAVNRFRRQPEPAATPAAPTTKECPHCLSTIPLKASRCGHCTSTLQGAELNV